MTERVLLVDDEPRLLDGLRRTLYRRYQLSTAGSGAEGLAAMDAAAERGEEFAVIVSDMMMPVMNGAQFLAAARGRSPDAVLMILSGQADLDSTIEAVNHADLFRFLTKPCEPEQLAQALDHALRQSQLIRGERDLLRRTLGGTVGVLTDVLSMASPVASRRTTRIRAMVAGVADQLGLADDWRLPIAAMLSQIGCVAVPGEVLEKVELGGALTVAEQAAYTAHPVFGGQLLARIPRLEQVAAWVAGQPTDVDRVGPQEAPADQEAAQEEVDAPGRVLEAIALYLLHCDAGRAGREGLRGLRATGRYPTALLDAIAVVALAVLEQPGVHAEVTVDDLRSGMMLDADVLTVTGQVLVRKGERVNPTLTTRLRNFDATIGLIQPLRVFTPEPPPTGRSGP
jgi:CheY-like chemotaxis protein